MVHDGFVFGSLYTGSVMDYVPNGYHYTLTRIGGWLGAPTLQAFMVDTGGGENQ
jgi:hypothetical protein